MYEKKIRIESFDIDFLLLLLLFFVRLLPHFYIYIYGYYLVHWHVSPLSNWMCKRQNHHQRQFELFIDGKFMLLLLLLLHTMLNNKLPFRFVSISILVCRANRRHPFRCIKCAINIVLLSFLYLMDNFGGFRLRVSQCFYC